MEPQCESLAAFTEETAPTPDPRTPWVARTASSVTHEGTEWIVSIDWAENTNYVRVPAAVTVSCLGGNLTQTSAPSVDPVAITRGVLSSIPWARMIEESRDRLVKRSSIFEAIVTHDTTEAEKGRSTAAAPTGRNRTHDEVLRLVAHHYNREGGQARGKAKAIQTALQLAGVEPMRRGRYPTDSDSDDTRPLSLSTVYRWIEEAKVAGYIREGSASK